MQVLTHITLQVHALYNLIPCENPRLQQEFLVWQQGTLRVCLAYMVVWPAKQYGSKSPNFLNMHRWHVINCTIIINVHYKY